jgi:uncharacterized protein YecE (DUF72 family)
MVEISSSWNQDLRPELIRLWMRKVAANPSFRFTVRLHQRFTEGRDLSPEGVAKFKEGLWPMLQARKLGCVLMEFPWSFRFTQENKEYLIALRRAFHEFPLATEMRHASWMREEALGTLIDYNVGICNIDQPESMKAMPPTSFLTSATGYVRLHGRQGANSLYTPEELAEWKGRIEKISRYSKATYIVFANDGGGRSVINALQMQGLFGIKARPVPRQWLHRFQKELGGAVQATQNRAQPSLFPSHFTRVA